jgi:hypothetical protein
LHRGSLLDVHPAEKSISVAVDNRNQVTRVSEQSIERGVYFIDRDRVAELGRQAGYFDGVGRLCGTDL